MAGGNGAVGKQCGFGGSRRLAAQGDHVVIAAEGIDIGNDPFQGLVVIHQDIVSAVALLLRVQLGQRQVAEHGKPLGHGYHHDAPAGQLQGIKLYLIGVAMVRAAAVEPDINRQLFLRRCRGRRNVQVQAVLALRGIAHKVEVRAPGLRVQVAVCRLHAHGAVAVAAAQTGPGLRVLRRSPTQRPHRRLCKGNAPELGDALVFSCHLHALDQAAGGFYNADGFHDSRSLSVLSGEAQMELSLRTLRSKLKPGSARTGFSAVSKGCRGWQTAVLKAPSLT